jgi:hypothetical protein
LGTEIQCKTEALVVHRRTSGECDAPFKASKSGAVGSRIAGEKAQTFIMDDASFETHTA